jgi:hypothetical protein
MSSFNLATSVMEMYGMQPHSELNLDQATWPPVLLTHLGHLWDARYTTIFRNEVYSSTKNTPDCIVIYALYANLLIPYRSN